MFDLLEEFGGKYNQCHFSCDEKARVVKIVSMSSRQFDQARKLITDRLAGEKQEDKTGKNKEGKGGGGKGPGKGAKISTKTGSSEVLSISKGHKLTVKRSNIVEEDVDAIVNAANSRLDHGAGVAGALSKASRGELQRASDTYVRNYGQVPVGGAALTSAGGKLKCKRVIHAVGPIASSQMTDLACSQLIYQAITNSLIEAEKMKAVSVSFPALSTGIYAVNKSLAAEAIFQAILKEVQGVLHGLDREVQGVLHGLDREVQGILHGLDREVQGVLHGLDREVQGILHGLDREVQGILHGLGRE
uniref:Macro domain-containing protein n=1 Tax=Amphimedon queenslandica TaxID=400682 RepID=A0A1X7SKE8_AMPQE